MPAPTFLCIGAQKCGTTWLAAAVAQHPEVAVGRKKELHYFNRAATPERDLAWYERQFRTGPQTRAIGEFTPNYWWTVGTGAGHHVLGAHDRIADAYPDLQLVLCLRDPVDRAVSAYFHNLQAGRYPPSTGLAEAIERYPGIREFGRYATQLEAWLTRFPLERLLVLVYEDDIAPDGAKPATLRRTFTHLGVDPDVTPSDLERRRNIQGDHFELRLRHASPARRAVMERLPARVRASSRWRIEVSAADRAALAALYRPEVARLETLLGRTFPWSLDA